MGNKLALRFEYTSRSTTSTQTQQKDGHLHNAGQAPYTVNSSNRVDLMASGRLNLNESMALAPNPVADPGVRVPKARARDIVHLAEQAGDSSLEPERRALGR